MIETQGSKSTTTTLNTPLDSNGSKRFDGFFTVKLHTTGKRVIWGLAIPVILWLAFTCFYFITGPGQLALIWKIFLGLLSIVFIGSAWLGIKHVSKGGGLYFRGIRFVGNFVEVGTIVTPCGVFSERDEDCYLKLDNPNWAGGRSKKREPLKFFITIYPLKASSSQFSIRQVSLTSGNDPPFRVINNSRFCSEKFCIIRNNEVYLFSRSFKHKSNEKLLEQLELMGVIFEAFDLKHRGDCTLKVKSPWNTIKDASTAAFWSLWAAYGMDQNRNTTVDKNGQKIYLIDTSFDKKFFPLIEWFGWRVEIF